MTWWEGKEIKKDSKTRSYEIPTEVTKANSHSFFEGFLSAAKHISHWIISYRDQAYPSEAEIKKIVSLNGKSSRMKSKTHQYSISAKHGENSLAKERLFICSPSGAKAAVSYERNVHTRILGTVDSTSLSTEAEKAGDKQFRFILTHAGTNRNGDHFTSDELKQAAETAVGKKIDLSHSQEFRDIVGGILQANYIEDGENSRVECVGELYTEESEPARLAYKLMKRGIVSYVSMECDYETGECSVCGKKIKNKGEYCSHLKNFKGRQYQNKPCFEILRGVTFTGMGLLDREGADERAEIKKVAHYHNEQRGECSMADDKNTRDTPVDPAGLSEAEKDKLISKQQSEIDRLMKDNEGLQKKLDEAQAAHQAAVRKTKANTLLKTWEEAGREFESDTSRSAEIDRLLKMSDDAFAATEEAVSAIAASKKKPKDDPDDEDLDDEEEDKKKKKRKANLKSDAGVSPASSSNPASNDLEAKLTRGFMAAYKDRAGLPAGE